MNATVTENAIQMLALIGLRALAEYDAAEYARATDQSKRDLDEQIDKLLESFDGVEDPVVPEVRSKLSQLRSISNDSRGRTEARFLLRQLHISALQYAQQLSLQHARTPRTAKAKPEETQKASVRSQEAPPVRSPDQEFVRLAIMRLLRELPEYEALFEVGSGDHRVDCVLTPSVGEHPIIIVEAKRRFRLRDLDSLKAQLKRYLVQFGKDSLAVLITSPLNVSVASLKLEIPGRELFVLQFDMESNSFVGKAKAELVSRVQSPDD